MRIQGGLSYVEHSESVFENLEMTGGDLKVSGGSVNISNTLSGTIRNIEVAFEGSLYAKIYGMERTGFCIKPQDGEIYTSPEMQDRLSDTLKNTVKNPPTTVFLKRQKKSEYEIAKETIPNRIRLAKELRGLFKPESEYKPRNRKYRSSPWQQIYNAQHMKIDTSEYWSNRTYFSKLYKSMRSANIPHQDILAVWGNPYINIVTNWDRIPKQRQQGIRTQYRGIDNIADKISDIQCDFVDVLCKTKYEVFQFVNDFAIPVTTISSMYKGAPSHLKQAVDKVSEYMCEIADGFNRAMIPGYAAYADGGSVEDIAFSAGSDLILMYCGGKAVKIGWQGLKYAGAKFASALKPKTTQITWGMWNDLPKTMYKGKEYAKIGKYYYTQHAIDHMSFGTLKSKIPSSQVGKEGLDMRRIPSMVVEEVIKYGKKYKFYEHGEWRLNHTLGNVQIITTVDTKVVVTVRKGAK